MGPGRSRNSQRATDRARGVSRDAATGRRLLRHRRHPAPAGRLRGSRGGAARSPCAGSDRRNPRSRSSASPQGKVKAAVLGHRCGTRGTDRTTAGRARDSCRRRSRSSLATGDIDRARTGGRRAGRDRGRCTRRRRSRRRVTSRSAGSCSPTAPRGGRRELRDGDHGLARRRVARTRSPGRGSCWRGRSGRSMTTTTRSSSAVPRRTSSPGWARASTSTSSTGKRATSRRRATGPAPRAGRSCSPTSSARPSWRSRSATRPGSGSCAGTTTRSGRHRPPPWGDRQVHRRRVLRRLRVGADAAVEAAVAIQRALRDHRLAGPDAVRVRIGLHTADANLRGDRLQRTRRPYRRTGMRPCGRRRGPRDDRHACGGRRDGRRGGARARDLEGDQRTDLARRDRLGCRPVRGPVTVGT